ncbi:MAG: 4-alpha-glucanotransferase [Candidatus Omnitrophica bacterium]|nr:4-alpha-glucanotransferase [Candidatus Omnitrophota bacterium]
MPEPDTELPLFNTISKDNWKKVGTKKRAGVLIPLFSAYSGDSFGIGDLGDLKLIVDWASLSANSIIQLLPMNEVGSLFCPYDALSSFALEPSYICLQDFASLKDKQFNFAPKDSLYVDYAAKKEKLYLLWDFYLLQDLSEEFAFEDFQKENAYWLQDFALFKVLKDSYQGKPWYEWEDKFKQRNRQALQEFWQDNIELVTFQMWLQWVIFKQFKSVQEYARSKNILLKGDLPVLVSRDSADVWAHPGFFKLDFAAGAPPDMYCAKGQRWGMPTYEWENIAKDEYRYIKEKLKYAENFYNILRIDHVVGLFRIWSIPYNDPQENQGLNGFFDPKDESCWAEHGRKILTILIKNTRMLLCAEDLGVVPKCCTDALLEFGMPGNDVQRWVKDWSVKHDFLEAGKYRALSVAMLSTHDTTNWPAWWENEAGTVDEGLFIRKCTGDRQINFENIKKKLFDPLRSQHGRLRWREDVDSVDKLVSIINEGHPPKGPLPKDHLLDFIDMYENTYREKEKLWVHLGIKGPMRERCDAEIMRVALKISLDAKAIFSINTIVDWLYPAGVFKDDPYQYRVNTPGTISPKNWSLRLPISLEELLKHPLNQQIRKMVVSSGRI